MTAHGKQFRASGDPYFAHPLEVAAILTDLKLDVPTIVTALLHDTIEDTLVTYDDLRDKFGEEIANLVDGVTKLSQLEVFSERTKQAENFRKLMLAITSDIRVLLVKLADRLHNMRTLGYIDKPDKRRRIAQETVDIYAPLAGRIGMQNMREELEDLAFAELDPEARNSIVTHFARLDMVGGDRVGRIADQIKRRLAEHGMEAWVYGRGKRPFSIWRKLQTKKLSFEQLSDIFGFRVIVGSAADCYRALGIIHTSWQMVPERFKDFISTPKPNGYRSIHTTVIGPEKQRVEIQIRTQEMHDIAERGVAAHWRYREHVPGTSGKEDSVTYGWLRDMVDLLERGDSAEEVLEHSRLAMYQDQVFCFTPKGSLISLPRGGHADRFCLCGAYRPGQQRGGRQDQRQPCPAAHAAEQWRPGGNHHHQGFLALADVGAVRGHGAGAGRNPPLPAPRPARRACPLRPQDSGKDLRRRGPRTDRQGGRRSGQETAPGQGRRCLCRCGRGALRGHEVLQAVFPELKRAGKVAKKSEPGEVKPISIRGLTEGISYTLGQCCHPLPGDRIVGINTPGEGLVIHTIDCAELDKAHNMDDWLDVGWGRGASDMGLSVARILVRVKNAPGSLATVMTAIAANGGNIFNMKVTDRNPLFFEFIVDVEVRDVAHLQNILGALRVSDAVESVDRVREAEGAVH